MKEKLSTKDSLSQNNQCDCETKRKKLKSRGIWNKKIESNF